MLTLRRHILKSYYNMNWLHGKIEQIINKMHLIVLIESPNVWSREGAAKLVIVGDKISLYPT